MDTRFQRYYRRHRKQRLAYGRLYHYTHPDKLRKLGMERWRRILGDPQKHELEKERNRLACAKYRATNRGLLRFRARVARRKYRQVVKSLKTSDTKAWKKVTDSERRYRKAYYEANKIALRKKAQVYYQRKRSENIEAWRRKRRIMARQRRAQNPDYYKWWYRKHNMDLRLAAIDAYGGRKCRCCGETMVEFLSIDHIEGGGNRHRKRLGLASGAGFYRWLRKLGYPSGFQILCMNCNWAKRLGSCPHQNR